MNTPKEHVRPSSRRYLVALVLQVIGLVLVGLGYSSCSSDNTLGIDFTSDPDGEIIDVETEPEISIVRKGELLGEVSSREQFGAPCTGVIERTPAYTLRLQEAMPLRLVVRADASDDLVVVLTGRYTTRCNDDFEGRNPGMQVYLQAGDYDVYVGTAQEQESPTPYALELMPADPERPYQGLSRAMLNVALQRRDTWSSAANDEGIRALQRRINTQRKAFEQRVPVEPPNLNTAPRYPRVRIDGNLSGEIFRERFTVRADAALWPLDPQCGGYVDTYGSDVTFDVPRGYTGGISCAVDADNEVKIAVQSPNDTWRCGGRRDEGHAVVEWAPWAAGRYRVFVATTLARAVLEAELVCKTVSD